MLRGGFYRGAPVSQMAQWLPLPVGSPSWDQGRNSFLLEVDWGSLQCRAAAWERVSELVPQRCRMWLPCSNIPSDPEEAAWVVSCWSSLPQASTSRSKPDKGPEATLLAHMHHLPTAWRWAVGLWHTLVELRAGEEPGAKSPSFLQKARSHIGKCHVHFG